MRLPSDYDAWRLRGPEEWEEWPEYGEEVGEECGRYSEPDEDCPIAWRCTGTMIDDDGEIVCDTCWEKAK